MKYFLIVGEASGDLHASHLMTALREGDPDADFCFFGGDRMSAVGGTRLRHYRDIAYMGFIPVLLHLRQIFHVMKVCKRFILRWSPDVVILVDYPGFNLSIADFLKKKTSIPVYYYISPKIWAWKEHRIEQIRRNVDELFSILPFEVPFFEEKHHYPIHYVGNPSVDEITAFRSKYHENIRDFELDHRVDNRPIIALLPGSRLQEVKDNLSRMCRAALSFIDKGYQLIIAGAPDISDAFYDKHLQRAGLCLHSPHVYLLSECTHQILSHAEAALVTSGTATLETALLKVPQVVCYYAPLGRLVSLLRHYFLKVKYISLVNLIVDREVVPELVADGMNVSNLRESLGKIVRGGVQRASILEGYEEMINCLGPAGAPQRAASLMLSLLREKKG